MFKLPAFCFNWVRMAWLFFTDNAPLALSNCTAWTAGTARVVLVLGRLVQPANISKPAVTAISNFLSCNQPEKKRELGGAGVIIM
ncbi:MAG: hypothetical protein ACYCZJ_07440 [Sulfuriferula sp.]